MLNVLLTMFVCASKQTNDDNEIIKTKFTYGDNYFELYFKIMKLI